ncbi:hypothetical protein [Komagataeibacter kakiaceti]
MAVTVMAMTAVITADMAIIMAARPSIITDAAVAADGAGAAVARAVAAAGVMDMAAPAADRVAGRAVDPVVVAVMAAAADTGAAVATAGVVDGADATAGSMMEPAPFSRAVPRWTEGS